MNYIGSKLSLLDFLDASMTQIVDKNCKIFCDLFAGTGMVGRHFKQKGYNIIANDIQHYSYVLNQHYINNHTVLPFENLISVLPQLKAIEISLRKNFVCQTLSNLEGTEGFIYQNYCLGGTQNQQYQRLYFTDENGKKCDAIRIQIEQWYQKNNITSGEYYFLLTTLIESIDKLANTASVYGAFLKKIKKSAQKNLVLSPAPHFLNQQEHKVFNENANSLITKIKGDILYLDPPYNHRQYAPNYHLLETISQYDSPILKGKTGLREYSKQKSAYCIKKNVKDVFTDLIRKADMKYIFLSYNNEGLLSLSDIREIMSERGEYGVFTQKYNRFKADKTENRTHKASETVEYLHYVIVK